jgi:hypothetical protein
MSKLQKNFETELGAVFKIIIAFKKIHFFLKYGFLKPTARLQKLIKQN